MKQPIVKKEYYLNFREMAVFICMALIFIGISVYFIHDFDTKIAADKLVYREISGGKTEEIRIRIKEIQLRYDDHMVQWNTYKNKMFNGTLSHLRGLTTLETADDLYGIVKKNNFGAIEENGELFFEVARKQYKNLSRKSDFGIIPIYVSLTSTFNELTTLLGAWSNDADRMWRLDELKIERDEESMPYHKMEIMLERLGFSGREEIIE